VVPIRGNLDTRIRKIETDGLDGVVVAAAGINRMGWGAKATQFIPPELIVPAVGQGALAVEVREGDNETRSVLSFLDDEDSRLAVTAERAFLKVFGGGCQLPIAAHAERRGADVVLTGLVGNLDGSIIVRDRVSGPPRDVKPWEGNWRRGSSRKAGGKSSKKSAGAPVKND